MVMKAEITNLTSLTLCLLVSGFEHGWLKKKVYFANVYKLLFIRNNHQIIKERLSTKSPHQRFKKKSLYSRRSWERRDIFRFSSSVVFTNNETKSDRKFLNLVRELHHLSQQITCHTYIKLNNDIISVFW